MTLLMTSVGRSAEDGHGSPHDLSHNDATAAIDDPLEANLDLAFFTLLVFLGLLGLLGAFAWKPIMNGLANREMAMDGKLAEAQRMFDEAEVKLNEYNRRLNESQQEIRQLREEALQAADEKGKQMIAEASENRFPPKMTTVHSTRRSGRKSRWACKPLSVPGWPPRNR
jgi:F-type H+-transporting ATPase subunit b